MVKKQHTFCLLYLEIVELNDALLHTKEWKGKSDTTEAYWEYKYRPN